MSLLNQINAPADLKQLPQSDLPKLAAEIRQLIIETCAKNGGHIAPSLGVVELTIALHKVFNSPEDKLIWDVGHQAYAHKIICGRRDSFNSLRTLDGISGFPKRCESEHDVWEVGHSSTSLSAATGYAVARDLSGRTNKVVVVIGDGDFISNSFIGNGGNRDLGTRIFDWLLADDALITIAEPVATDRTIALSGPALSVLSFAFLLVLPLLLAASGLWIWRRRRKR